MNNYQKYKKQILDTMSVTLLDQTHGALSELLGDDHELTKEYARLLDRLRPVYPTQCPKCGGDLYYSDLPDYSYTCPACDENFYEIEVK